MRKHNSMGFTKGYVLKLMRSIGLPHFATITSKKGFRKSVYHFVVRWIKAYGTLGKRNQIEDGFQKDLIDVFEMQTLMLNMCSTSLHTLNLKQFGLILDQIPQRYSGVQRGDVVQERHAVSVFV